MKECIPWDRVKTRVNTYETIYRMITNTDFNVTSIEAKLQPLHTVKMNFQKYKMIFQYHNFLSKLYFQQDSFYQSISNCTISMNI